MAFAIDLCAIAPELSVGRKKNPPLPLLLAICFLFFSLSFSTPSYTCPPVFASLRVPTVLIYSFQLCARVWLCRSSSRLSSERFLVFPFRLNGQKIRRSEKIPRITFLGRWQAKFSIPGPFSRFLQWTNFVPWNPDGTEAVLELD